MCRSRRCRPSASGAQKADDLSQFEAIQLFVERARGVRADFRLTDDNAAAVADICRRLDGLPLAIELATARLNLFFTRGTRERSPAASKALGSGARDLPERQQTLRATIEWSYQLLTPAEQRLFEILSAFAGASVEAVEAQQADLDHAVGGRTGPLTASACVARQEPGPWRPKRSTATRPRGSSCSRRSRPTPRRACWPDFADAARDAHARYFADLAKHSTTEAAATDLDNSSASPRRTRSPGRTLKLQRASRSACRSTSRVIGTTRRSSSPTTSSPCAPHRRSGMTTGRPS